jgi:hypothetical protein
MSLDRVPPYLIDALRILDPDRVQEVLADDRAGDLELEGVTERLAAWVRDGEFWEGLAENLPDTPPAVPLEDSLDQERVVLADALGGDFRLAGRILLEAPLRSEWPEPDRARYVVMILHGQGQELLTEPPSRRRAWRIARLSRRIFKAVGGGLLVAADIVAPDPTMLVRAASVWGGADMIIDAIEMR